MEAEKNEEEVKTIEVESLEGKIIEKIHKAELVSEDGEKIDIKVSDIENIENKIEILGNGRTVIWAFYAWLHRWVYFWYHSGGEKWLGKIELNDKVPTKEDGQIIEWTI